MFAGSNAAAAASTVAFVAVDALEPAFAAEFAFEFEPDDGPFEAQPVIVRAAAVSRALMIAAGRLFTLGTSGSVAIRRVPRSEARSIGIRQAVSEKSATAVT
jgi:hypothetical protein